jgi:Xaa-Pro aminopeptidase
MATLAETVKMAQAVCDAYSAAVKAAGYKSRWVKIDYAKHPEIAAARDAHYAAGVALHEAFEASRKISSRKRRPSK